jgi:hypothetical protein
MSQHNNLFGMAWGIMALLLTIINLLDDILTELREYKTDTPQQRPQHNRKK